MQAEQIDVERVTAGLKTKSDKIRALSRHGMPTADIARLLDIRYQHARNVLVHAGLHRVGEEAPVEGQSVTKPYAWVELSSDGSLTIPAELLAAAEIPSGPVHVRLTDDGIEIFSRKAALERVQAIARRFIPEGSPSLVDEFIADRRREAEREND